MAGFGERLRRERELRGIKLEEIAEATKISVRYLRALEDEDLSQLPGGIFSKGFVRAYAKYLGIDEEQAIADFVGMAGEAPTPLPEPPPEKPAIEERHSRWWIVAAIIGLVALGLYVGRKPLRRQAGAMHPSSAEAATAPNASAPGAASALPAAATTDTGPSPGSAIATAAPLPAATPQNVAANRDAATASKVVVKLHTIQQAWVQWSVDNGPTEDAVFPPNVQKTLAGNLNVKLKVGDAAAVELTYNGKTMPPLGKDKQVKTVTFTPAGVEQ